MYSAVLKVVSSNLGEPTWVGGCYTLVALRCANSRYIPVLSVAKKAELSALEERLAELQSRE